MTKKLLQFWLLSCVGLWLGVDSQLRADFVLDAFTTPTSEATSNIQASVGQTVTGTGLWDGRREFNITASFNVQSASLNISNGSLTHIVTPNAPSPLASMMLRYVDLSPSDTLPLPSGNLLIQNVNATSPFGLSVTLRGTNLPGGTTFSPNIAGGFNGNLLIPLNSFASSSSLGTLTEVQFDFTNTSGGQLTLGQISITSVPEPGSLGLAIIACGGAVGLRKRVARARKP